MPINITLHRPGDSKRKLRSKLNSNLITKDLVDLRPNLLSLYTRNLKTSYQADRRINCLKIAQLAHLRRNDRHWNRIESDADMKENAIDRTIAQERQKLLSRTFPAMLGRCRPAPRSPHSNGRRPSKL